MEIISDSGLVVIWFALSVLGFPHCTAVSRHHAWAWLSVPCIFSITCQDSLGVVIKFHWWGSIPVNYVMTALNPAAWQDKYALTEKPCMKEPALCCKRLTLSHTGHVRWGLPEAVSMSNPLILFSCIPHRRSQQNLQDPQEKIAYVEDVIMFPFGGNVWNLYHHLWCKVSCSPRPQVWEVLLMHGFVKREIMSDFHLSILPSPILASFLLLYHLNNQPTFLSLHNGNILVTDVQLLNCD